MLTGKYLQNNHNKTKKTKHIPKENHVSADKKPENTKKKMNFYLILYPKKAFRVGINDLSFPVTK